MRLPFARRTINAATPSSSNGSKQRSWHRLLDPLSKVRARISGKKRPGDVSAATTALAEDVIGNPAFLETSSSERPKNLPHDIVLRIPGFLTTPEDAEDLLCLVRSSQEECQHRKSAVEHAIYQVTVQIRVLQRHKPAFYTLNQSVSTLRILERELAKASDDLLKADVKLGAIRTLVRTKGFPVNSRPAKLFNTDQLDVDLLTDASSDEGDGPMTISEGHAEDHDGW